MEGNGKVEVIGVKPYLQSSSAYYPHRRMRPACRRSTTTRQDINANAASFRAGRAQENIAGAAVYNSSAAAAAGLGSAVRAQAGGAVAGAEVEEGRSRGHRGAGGSQRSREAESKRRRRVAHYKSFAVEASMKDSLLKKGLLWFRHKYLQVRYGSWSF